MFLGMMNVLFAGLNLLMFILNMANDHPALAALSFGVALINIGAAALCFKNL